MFLLLLRSEGSRNWWKTFTVYIHSSVPTEPDLHIVVKQWGEESIAALTHTHMVVCMHAHANSKTEVVLFAGSDRHQSCILNEVGNLKNMFCELAKACWYIRAVIRPESPVIRAVSTWVPRMTSGLVFMSFSTLSNITSNKWITNVIKTWKACCLI